MSPAAARETARFLGWAMLAATAEQRLPMVMALAGLFSTLPAVAAKLMLLFVPTMALSLVAATGLILGRHWGFFCAYAAAVVGLWTSGMSATTLLPFVQKALKLGPAEFLVTAIGNLLVILTLVWAQWRLAGESEPPVAAKLRRVAAGAAVLAVLVNGVWASQFRWGRGEAATVADLPVAGAALATLKASGPLPFAYFQSRWQEGLMLVCSGTATAEAVEDFAKAEGLTAIPADKQNKLLALLRSWRLDREQFAAEFGPDDLRFSGRLKGQGKTNFQICFRKADGRFTAQWFGVQMPGQ